jgi:hypothetical protein
MQRLRGTFKKNKKLNSAITISTLNGKLTVVRNIDYCSRCGKTFGQCDEMLGISNNHRITKDFLECVTYVAQMIPGYRNGQELLLKLTGLEISSSQIKVLSGDVGKQLFEVQMEKADYSFLNPEVVAPEALEKDKKEAVLYILTDGSAVNTRIQDIDGSTWKEIKLGLVFLDKDVIKRKNDSAIIIKKEYVSYLGSVIEFKKVLFDSAVKAGYGKVKKVVIIGDGAHWIWNMCSELFPDAECILDFYHMTENVFNYAKELFNHDEKKYTKWADLIIHYIKTEQVKKALKKIADSPLPSVKINNVPNLEGYIKNNSNRINYLEYRKKGYYIGSGMVESGNKIVVQKRMKQAGMRWSTNGAQYMAGLRAKHESNKWNDVVEFIYRNSKVA